MKVLVADDDDDIRFVVSALLSRRGWVVSTVNSGNEATAVLRESSFDVLVLDQNMPPGSGMEVVQELRGRGDDTPVILFTGFSATIERDLVDRFAVNVMEKTDVASLAARVTAVSGLG